MTIESTVCKYTWDIKGRLTQADVEFISRYSPAVYCNDLTAALWAFDTRLPSGNWLENISFSGDLKTARARAYNLKGD